MFYQGKTLEQLQENLSKSLSFAQKAKNQVAVYVNLGYKLAIQNLLSETADKLLFQINKINEAEYMESCQNHQSFMTICQFKILKSMILYLFGEPAEALRYAQDAVKLLDFNRGMVPVAEHNFYYSLILTALYPQASAEEQKQYMKQLKANQKQMKIWADSCPENFENMYLLVEAEIARVAGKVYEVIELYDKAIESARENEFIQNEALANELCAKFLLKRDKQNYASL